VKFEKFQNRPTVSFDKDRTGVIFDHPEPMPTLYFKECKVIEQDIAGLGDLRAELTPPVAETWPGGPVSGCRRDPAYSIEHDALAGDVLLHLRDERFGWLHYIITRDRARDFANKILAELGAPPPAMQGQA
jgi:hypothetical protein